jgi:endonuclease/exonuclease/phosphatase family metal-dependent hydrolase
MDVEIGTFNLNNLFSRYNFKGEIDAIQQQDTSVDSELEYVFGPSSVFKIRTYLGKLVKAKKTKGTERVVERIKRIDLDILAVQEVEDIDTMRQFNREYLDGMYPHIVLIEGNDDRLIDVGVFSKLPIGAITSWQQAVHPGDPTRPVFGRDLLQVEILNPSRTRKLFTIFNNHLKSHYVPFWEDPVTGQQSNDLRRTRQAEVIADIVKSETRPDSSFIILGDMNDPPDSACLSAFTTDPELGVINALGAPQETRPPKQDDPMPPSPAWTYRHKESGQPAEYRLYDQIWLSPALAGKQVEAWIDRRKRHTGDGSDHDPAWIKLRL